VRYFSSLALPDDKVNFLANHRDVRTHQQTNSTVESTITEEKAAFDSPVRQGKIFAAGVNLLFIQPIVYLSTSDFQPFRMHMLTMLSFANEPG
jgi:hypothetical protein